MKINERVNKMDLLYSNAIYMSTFLFSIVCSYIYQKQNINSKKFSFKKLLWFLLIIAFPVFVATIRSNDVGVDTIRYYSRYEKISRMDFMAAVEAMGDPLYICINILAKKLFDSFTGVLLLISLIIHFCVVSALDYYKENISMPFALFIYYFMFYFFTLNGMRQALAMAVVFFGLKYILEKKLINYLICIGIAFLFHKTSVICIVFYFLSFIVSKRRNRIAEIVYNSDENGTVSKNLNRAFYGLVIISYFIMPVFFIIASYIPILGVYFAAYELNFANAFTSIRFLNTTFVPLSLVFLYKKKILNKNANYNGLVNVSILSIIVHYTGNFMIFLVRLTLYFSVTYMILIPLVIRVNRDNDNKLIYGIGYVAYFIMFYVSQYLMKNIHSPFPYTTIFDLTLQL